MPYQGRQPGVGVRNRFIFTATSGQTSFSGADSNGLTLKYPDATYTDVFLNGVLLPPTDYTATTKTSVVLGSGAAVNDILEVVAYDIASIANTVPTSGGTFTGPLTVEGTVTADGLTVDGDAVFRGADPQLTISDIDTGVDHVFNAASGVGNLVLDFDRNNEGSAPNFYIQHNTQNIARFQPNGDFNLYNSAGTSTKFFWDASAERLGIGVTDPLYPLEVQGEAGIELYNGSGGGSVLNFRPSLGDANKYNLSISSYDHSGGGVGPSDGLSINGFDGVSFATGSSNTRQERMRISSSGTLTARGAVILNEDGGDKDFRVESDTNTHALFVDGGNNSVSIGTSTQSAVLTIHSAGNGYSSGAIALKGAGISDTNYLTNAGGSFYISLDGTRDDFVIRPSDLVINESGTDRDFRVESDSNSHMLFVDAGGEYINVNTSATYLGGKLNVGGNKGTGSGIPSSQLVVADFTALREGGGGAIQFNGIYDSNNNITAAGSIEAYKRNATSGDYGFGLWFKSRTHGGTNDERLYMDQDKTVFNDISANTDFRVESDSNANMLFVDAGNDRIGMGVSNPSHSLTVAGNVGSRYDNDKTSLLSTGYYGAFIHASPNVPQGVTSYVNHFEGTVAVAGQGYASHTMLGTKRNGTASWNTGAFIGYGGNDAGPTREWIFDTNGGFSASGTKNFKVKHPLPSLQETHVLIHAAIEGPNADLIYRGVATLSSGLATVNIDAESRMSDGTFVALTRDAQSFTSNETDWTPVRGSVSGNTLTIEAQDNTSTAKVSWMVVAKRNDTDIINLDATNDSGEFITERLENA